MVGFVILAVMAVGTAVGVVSARQPVHNALFLVGNIVALALFYFTLGARFMGVAQVIVYAGAVMVLFLFVVTLLSAGKAPIAEREDLPGQRWVGGGLAAAVGVTLVVVVTRYGGLRAPAAVGGTFGGLHAMGRVLWGPFFVFLAAVAFMLLTAGLGVLVLNRPLAQITANPQATAVPRAGLSATGTEGALAAERREGGEGVAD